MKTISAIEPQALEQDAAVCRFPSATASGRGPSGWSRTATSPSTSPALPSPSRTCRQCTPDSSRRRSHPVQASLHQLSRCSIWRRSRRR
ncbi:hypothetical protein C4D60_Mb11t08010 [Musa balbisiana]|uniref:Uncharacterized protein n=1 Tax=Musa balbisiana TaxID=52838 RepID=A0A4S8J2P3_MUSBA|nr:hypothetical protein C4D60_Mb11t08010 [Musa balbisiana]